MLLTVHLRAAIEIGCQFVYFNCVRSLCRFGACGSLYRYLFDVLSARLCAKERLEICVVACVACHCVEAQPCPNGA